MSRILDKDAGCTGDAVCASGPSQVDRAGNGNLHYSATMEFGLEGRCVAWDPSFAGLSHPGNLS